MPETKFPTTLEEAVEYLYSRFDGMDKYFKCQEDQFTAFCHSQLSGGIGMKIRNELGLWEMKNDLCLHIKSVHQIEHPEDQSGLILKGIYKRYHAEHPDTVIDTNKTPLSNILKQVSPKPR